MAKIKKSIQTWSGKMGELVYVDNRSHGSYVRRAVAAGTKKNEPALKRQYSRTGFLNSVASDVNRIVGKYASVLKPKRFYQDVQKLLRKESEDNRLLVLTQLKGMEVNQNYTLGRLGRLNCCCSYRRNALTVELATAEQPQTGQFLADCYYYVVILVLWGKGQVRGQDSAQLSEWVAIQDQPPVFEFEFPRPAKAQQWLLCVHLVLGRNEQRIESVQAEGMQIADAGSFDKKDIALLAKKNEMAIAKEKKEMLAERRVLRKRQ